MKVPILTDRDVTDLLRSPSYRKSIGALVDAIVRCVDGEILYGSKHSCEVCRGTPILASRSQAHKQGFELFLDRLFALKRGRRPIRPPRLRATRRR